MLKFAEKFIEEVLKQDDVTFNVYEMEKATLVIVPSGDYDTLFFFQGEDGQNLRVVSILPHVIPEENFMDAILLCNSFNKNYPWSKFYVDEDDEGLNRINVINDMALDEHTVSGEIVLLWANRNESIKDATQFIMKMLWTES